MLRLGEAYSAFRTSLWLFRCTSRPRCTYNSGVDLRGIDHNALLNRSRKLRTESTGDGWLLGIGTLNRREARRDGVRVSAGLGSPLGYFRCPLD